MKTLRRKLFLSILAVAFAVVSLATSTFAWFAMNDTVEVSGMKAKINSDYAYLLIGESDDAATIQAAKTKEVNFNMTDQAAAVVYPVAHETIANLAAAETKSNWYYMYSDNVSSSTGVQNTKTTLADKTVSQYYLLKTVYVTLAPGSQDMANLKVKSVTITGGALAESTNVARVLVAGANGSQEFDATNADVNNGTTLVSSITDAAAVQVNIYIFWEGSHADVKTDNIESLEALISNVSLTFTASIPQA